jgi:hypothetical protein
MNKLEHNPLIRRDIHAVSMALRPLCNVFNGHRFFLAGGTGFFGKWLLQTFIQLRKSFDLNSILTVLSRDPKRFFDSCTEFVSRRHEYMFAYFSKNELRRNMASD